MKYKVISTDDHLQEAPHTWTDRMSKAKWGDKIPHLRHNQDGTDNWFIYGERMVGGVGVVNGAMKDRAEVPAGGPSRWDEVPDIAYVPAERIKAMDQDGVDVHTFFGNIAGVAGNTFNAPKAGLVHGFGEALLPADYRLDAIRAFNDYQIEEWAAPYPGRFITLAIVPLWDVTLALAELNRALKLGFKGISFAFPQQWSYAHIADPAWDPFWAAAEESGLSVNFHIGSGGAQGFTGGPNPTYKGLTPMLQLATVGSRFISANTDVMSTVLFSLMPERFPRLKLVSSESGLGWVPYLLEMADHHWEGFKLERSGMRLKPSDYFHRQCYVNFWYESMGLRNRDLIGVDNILWESDYPHPTSTWPNSQHYIQRIMSQVTEEERQKFLVDNAVRVFNLDPR